MRLILLRVLLVAAFLFLIVLLMVERVPALTDDFMAYWSAARLLAHGGNPYDPAALLSIQRAQGWRYNIPLPTWYGPWVLAASVPVSLLAYWPARLGWLALQVVTLFAAAALLGRLYVGSNASRRPLLLAITFAPAVLCLAEGQITPLLLLGLAVFLVYSRRRRDLLAGAALFPLTAKPLALYLLWPALVMWAFHSRRWGVLAGLVISTAAGSALALALNPSVLLQWLHFSATYSPLEQSFTPTLGSVLRYLFGSDRYWLAYLPAVAGLLWLVPYWRRHQSNWGWTERVPALALASVVTTPFIWSHDALLLLPAVFQVAAHSWSRADTAVWLPVNAAAVLLYPFLRLNQVWYLFYFGLLVAWYLWHSIPRFGLREAPVPLSFDET